MPYKGSAPAVSDLLGGQIQLMFADAPSAIPYLKAGKLRALAVGSLQRSALFAGVPTMAESGLAGYEAYSWAGFLAPRGSSPDIVHKASVDLRRAMSDATVKQRLYDAGAEARPTTPDEFATFLQAEIVKWAAVVKAANIRLD